MFSCTSWRPLDELRKELGAEDATPRGKNSDLDRRSRDLGVTSLLIEGQTYLKDGDYPNGRAMAATLRQDLERLAAPTSSSR
jgi:hypothetical protein